MMHNKSDEPDRKQINALADAIIRYTDWRQRMHELREAQKVKRMMYASRLRQNRKASLSD